MRKKDREWVKAEIEETLKVRLRVSASIIDLKIAEEIKSHNQDTRAHRAYQCPHCGQLKRDA